jgi:Ankyrin repeats (many copies)
LDKIVDILSRHPSGLFWKKIVEISYDRIAESSVLNLVILGRQLIESKLSKSSAEEKELLKKSVLDRVHLLLEHGADVNLQSRNGWTPLTSAAFAVISSFFRHSWDMEM